MADDRFRYKPINDEDMVLYNKYKDSIESEVRAKFPSIPADFELQPLYARHMEACGTIHDYKIATPDNQFIKISFLTGGYYVPPANRSADWKPPEPEISVADNLTTAADDF